jgi:hypothetical protein
LGLLAAFILGLNLSAYALPEDNNPLFPRNAAMNKKAKISRQITSVPLISSMSPSRNQLNVARNTSVSLTFSEAMSAATASNSAIRVYGSRTGKRSGSFGGAGTSVATFDATQAFKPGETVSVITTTAAQNAGGSALAQAQVYQFTVAGAIAPANFIANPTLTSGSTPHGIFPADLDGDGDVDVAVANAGANFLTVRMNNGDATFAASVNVALPGSAEAVFAADLDGDGDMDLASANTGIGSVSVRMNNGSGSFSGGNDYAASATAGSKPSDITGADFDGDGDIDLATTLKAQNTIAVFINDGAGNFSRNIMAGGSSPHGISTADFDSDGDMDLAVTNTTSFLVTIKMNDGTGFFSGGSTVSIASNSQSIQAVDFNGDGKVDLAAANIGSNSVSVRTNDGTGTFSGSTEVPVGTRPYGLYAGDIDGDGDMDLVTANQGSNDISVRLNSGTGVFSGTTDVDAAGTQTWALQLADFDGDNDLDIGVVNGASNRYVILLNKLSTGTNTPPTISSPANQSGCANTSSSAIAFTVGDEQTAVASLAVTATSSNLTLIPQANISLGGSGANRTVTLSPATNQTGTSTITLSVADESGETVTATFTYTVNALPIVVAGGNESVCTNTAAFSLSGFSPAGGTWSGDGVSAAGVFTPSAILFGTNTLTYTVTQDGCTVSATKNVTVDVVPAVVAGNNENVCANAAAFTLTGFSPAGGTWSGNGVSAAGVFTPATSLVGTQTLTYTITQNGCTGFDTKTVTVAAVPTVVAGSNQSVCADAAAFNLSGFSPAGGTWSGSGVSAAGVFTPSASLIGTRTLTYTITQNGCTASATRNITVNATPAIVAGTNQNVCAGAASFALTGFSPAGGTWSGSGVSAAGVFTPSASLIGTQTLTYTMTLNGCTASATKTITVNAVPSVVAGANESVCADAEAFSLSGFSPAGGTWSGSGVSAAGVFTPSVSLIGAHTLTYTVTQNGCTASATKTVTVTAPITVDVTKTDNTDCINPNGSIHLTLSGGTAPYTINWTNGFTNEHLTGLSAGSYQVLIADASSCSVVRSFTVSDPNAPTTFDVNGGGSYCQGGAGLVIGLSGSQIGVNYQVLRNGTPEGNPVSGTGGALDFGLQTAAGTYTVAAKNTGGCSSTMTGSATIILQPNPSLSITNPPAVCTPATVNLTTVTVTDAANTTGTLSYWTNATATVALPNPESVSASGTYYIKKTTSGGCSDIKPVEVTIGTTLTAQAGANQTVCASDASFTMAGFSPAGGTWSGNGVDAAGVFTPAASLIGTQTLTYTVSQGSCAATATKTITVKSVPNPPTAGANNPTVGESLLLTATTVANASYQWAGPLGFTSAEQNPVIPQATLAHSGTYTVTVTADGCTSPAATVQVVVSPPVVPNAVNFSLESVDGNTGTSVVVRVRVKDFKNILSAQGSIQWNPAVASFQGVDNFGLPGMTNSSFGTTQAGNGSLVFSWSDTGLTPRSLPDNATLFSVRFNLTGNTGTSTAVSMNSTPVVVEVVGQGNQEVPATIENGQIRVVSVTSVAGSIKSAVGNPIRGVGFEISNSNVTQTFSTAPDGLFQLTVPVENFTIKPFKNNDVVSNNGVSTLDLILIQRHILGLGALDSPYKIIAADVNQSGSVSTLDIVLIRSLILQNTTTFPGNRLWSFVSSNYQFADPTNPFPFDNFRAYTATGTFSGQNFVGVKLGDVNNSWDAAIARIETEGEVTFRTEDQQVLPDQEVLVPLKVRNFKEVSGYQFTFNWDPTVLEFVEVQHQGLTGNYGLEKIGAGKLTTTWQDSHGNDQSLPDDSTAFNLRFKVVGGLGSESALRINSSLTTSEAYNRHLGYLSMVSPEAKIRVGEAVEPIQPYDLRTGQPNPFQESTLIGFSLPKEEEVNLSIYNQLGQLVQSYNGHYPAGKHQIRWMGTSEAGQQLSAGTYLVRMQAGSFVKSTKLVKIH